MITKGVSCNWLVVATFLLQLSCNNSDIKEIEMIEVNENVFIDDTKSIQQKDFLDQIKSIQFVKLQKTSESLISEINEIIPYNNNFFILDKLQKKILVFNNNGNFEYQIAYFGKGPGEYSGITWFDILPDEKRLVIYDRKTTKLIWYDIDGHYVKEITTNLYFNKFKFSDNNSSIFIHFGREPRSIPDGTEERTMLVELDLDKMEIINKYFPYQDTMDKLEVKLPNNFSYIGQNLSYFKPFDNHIYDLSRDNGISAKYKFIFKTDFINEQILEESKPFNRMMNNLIEKDIIITILNYYETDKSIKLSYMLGQYVNTVYYDKNKKSVFHISGEGQNGLLGLFIAQSSCVYNNKFVSAIEPIRLIKLKDKLKQSGMPNPNINDVDEEDNFYLLLYDF